MEKVTNIAKNTSYLTLALILQKIASFVYFALLAKALSPELLGSYYFAVSFTTIFGIIMDLGLLNLMTRETAKNPQNAHKYLGGVLAMKIPLTLIAITTVVISINSMDYSSSIRMLVYISIISMVLDSFSTTFFASMRGFHNLKFESIAAIIFQVLVLVLGFLSIKLGLGVVYQIAVLSCASFANFVFSLFCLRKNFRLPRALVFEREYTLKFLQLAFPFGLYAIFQRLYTYLDSVLLSIFAGEYYVGLYQVAFKIVFALQFLPMAFTASLYPAMSAYWQNNKEQLVITFERAMNYLFIISIPIVVGILVLADKIVALFGSSYDAAILPLRIIILALLFLFLNYPIGSVLNATDRQKKNTVTMAVMLVFSIVLNLILIPRYQTLGASITVLATNILGFVVGMYWISKVIKLRLNKLAPVALKSLLCAGLMGIVCFYFSSFINIFVLVLVSAVLYFVLLMLFRAYTLSDIRSVYNSFAKNK